jgi:hypothetical protein
MMAINQLFKYFPKCILSTLNSLSLVILKQVQHDIARSEMKSTINREKHGFNIVFTSDDFCFTAKNNYVHVISLTSTKNETISVKSLFDYRKKIRVLKFQ